MGFTTDHFPTIIEIPTGGRVDTTVYVQYRKLKDIDLPCFKQDLEQLLNEIDVDNTSFAEHNTEFDSKSREILDKHAPLVLWKRKCGEPPWLDQEYRKNRALRRKYERLWKKQRTDMNMQNYLNQKFYASKVQKIDS